MCVCFGALATTGRRAYLFKCRIRIESIRELAEAVAQATGFIGTIDWDSTKPDGTPKKQLDVSRLASLGWRARISLDEGLVNTVSLFREQLAHHLIRL